MSFLQKKAVAVEPFFIVWCAITGTNDGGSTDTGELQGATISTSAWVIAPSGELTADSDNTAAVQIHGVDYGVNTVATIWLSGGAAGTRYVLTNTVTLSDSRTLTKSITIEVT